MQGILFIVSAPSGAGKTSLVRGLIARDPSLSLSVSYTTRPPRPGEVDGRDYHFVDRATFETLARRGDFLESAEVYGNYYGTSQPWVAQKIAQGQDILLEIDCQGAAQVRRAFPEAVSVYILPPSLEALESRLRSRAQDDPQVIERRLKAAREEVSRVAEFDYVIINNQLEEALEDLVAIVRAERLKLGRQIARHRELLARLMTG